MTIQEWQRGDVLRLPGGRVILVGDVNSAGGTCGCCEWEGLVPDHDRAVGRWQAELLGNVTDRATGPAALAALQR